MNSLRQCLFIALSLWIFSLQKEGTTHCSPCSTCTPCGSGNEEPVLLSGSQQGSGMSSAESYFILKKMRRGIAGLGSVQGYNAE